MYWAIRIVTLQTFSITQRKTVQYVACSHLYQRSTQTYSNLSHFPPAADAKDAVPCSNGLLVGRKNIRNLVSKDLERFQGLFGINWLMPYKTQNNESTILLWFHMHLFSLSLLTLYFFLSFCPLALEPSILSRAEFTKCVFRHHHFLPCEHDQSLIKCGQAA